MAFVPTDEEAVPKDPAEGLAAVVALRRLADRLEAGQVERAVVDGWSWREIAAALEVVGVPASVVASTPIHPRADRPSFGVPMKQALEHALQEAVRRGDRRLRPEHVLLGLLSPPAVGLRRVLTRLDVEPRRLA